MRLRTFQLAFVNRPPALNGRRWAALIVAAMLLVFATWYEVKARGDGARARSDWEASQQHLKSNKIAPVSAEARRHQQERVLAVNGYIRALNLPWDAIFRQLMPPSAVHVSLLGIETGDAQKELAGAGDAKVALRISAAAERAEDMTEYVAYLVDHHALKGVTLTRHEIGQDGPSATGELKFQVEASWPVPR